ncbi:MAG: membrane protein insertion efficiency factor YidD [Clostridia bacterium]|nr:membrane protein insertion efficiency factor YidD [Clostridia bacterium]
MKKAVLWLIGLYRRWLSPLKRPGCRFYPTCSTYALQAVEEWGVFRGLCLAFWRILRCNPFCRGGIDHVPKRNARTMTAGQLKYRSRK